MDLLYDLDMLDGFDMPLNSEPWNKDSADEKACCMQSDSLDCIAGFLHSESCGINRMASGTKGIEFRAKDSECGTGRMISAFDEIACDSECKAILQQGASIGNGSDGTSESTTKYDVHIADTRDSNKGLAPPNSTQHYRAIKEELKIGKCKIFVINDSLDTIIDCIKPNFVHKKLILIYSDKGIKTANFLIERVKLLGVDVVALDASMVKSGHPVDDRIRAFGADFMLVVGFDNTVSKAKKMAKNLKIDLGAVLLSPAVSTMLVGGGVSSVFVSRALLQVCPNELVVSAVGILLSQKIADFDILFERKVLGKAGCVAVMSSDIASNIANAETTQDIDQVALSIELLKISARKTRLDSLDIASIILGHIHKASKSEVRPFGEYRMLLALTIKRVYMGFLASPTFDILPPPCHTKNLDYIASIMDLSCSNLVKSVDFFSIVNYFRISYVLSEYRIDLLDKLSSINIDSDKRCWKRLYSDAGFALSRSNFSGDILSAVTYAGSLSGGLLGYLGQTGFVDRFDKMG